MTVPVACNACGMKPELHTEREQRILYHVANSCDGHRIVIADRGGEPSGPMDEGPTDQQTDDALADRWNALMIPPAERGA